MVFGRRRRGSGTREDVHGLGRLEPSSVVVEVSIGADGAREHVHGFEAEIAGGLQDDFEDAGKLTRSGVKESSGVGVAINRGAVRDLVIRGNFLGALPADEIGFDGVALRVIADDAQSLVTIEIRRTLGVLAGD